MGKIETAEGTESQVAKKNNVSQEETVKGNPFSVLQMSNLKKMRSKSCCHRCTECLFVILGIVAIVKCIAVIVVSISTAIATKLYSSQQSGRMVAMITISVTAAVALSIIIYAVVGVFRKYKKPLHAASVVLTILAILQAVISGVSVKVNVEDEQNLTRSLLESFQLAREDNPRHVKLWDTTNHDLMCCGVYGAEDYRDTRNFFVPDVPISCCPTYDPSRSDLVQEREREACKARRTYYVTGCKQPVLDMFKETAAVVLTVTIILIVLEIILAILAGLLYKKQKERELSPGDSERQAQNS